MRLIALLLLAACAVETPAVDAAGDTDVVGADSDTEVVPGDTDTVDDTVEDPPDDSEPPPVDDTPPAPSSGCGIAPDQRSYTLNMRHNNTDRTALVDLPPGYDGSEALPVVLNFHGNAFDSATQRGYTGMAGAANDRGWIAVHPNGLFRTWNVLPGSTDVAFTGALIDELSSSLCIDESRVYVTGMSQGGNLAYLIACALTERVAAIAPVAGSDVSVICAAKNRNPRVPMPILHIHGTADAIVEYGGGLLYRGAEESVTEWAEEVHQCDAAPVETRVIGAVSCETRSCSDASETTLCSIDGGGHTWPGAPPIPLLDETNNDIDASEEILDFFGRWSR